MVFLFCLLLLQNWLLIVVLALGTHKVGIDSLRFLLGMDGEDDMVRSLLVLM